MGREQDERRGKGWRAVAVVVVVEEMWVEVVVRTTAQHKSVGEDGPEQGRRR